MNFTGRPARFLDFDCECRPLSFGGGDWVSKDLTAIAAQFIGETKMHVWALGEIELEQMLYEFTELYDRADAVVGHFIRKFDLPLVNGMLLEMGIPPLAPKMTSDTCLDVAKSHGVSRSQESLAEMLGVKSPKVGMSQAKWRLANRLSPQGIAATKKRVTGDVRQNIELRQELLRRGWLGRPKRWTPAR